MTAVHRRPAPHQRMRGFEDIGGQTPSGAKRGKVIPQNGLYRRHHGPTSCGHNSDFCANSYSVRPIRLPLPRSGFVQLVMLERRFAQTCLAARVHTLGVPVVEFTPSSSTGPFRTGEPGQGSIRRPGMTSLTMYPIWGDRGKHIFRPRSGSSASTWPTGGHYRIAYRPSRQARLAGAVSALADPCASSHRLVTWHLLLGSGLAQ